MKIKNKAIFELFVNSVSKNVEDIKGINKLVSSDKMDVILAYKVSILYGNLYDQFKIIDEARQRINKKYTNAEGKSDLESIVKDFNLILEEEFEMGDEFIMKISDVKDIGITPIDFVLLKGIIKFE